MSEVTYETMNVSNIYCQPFCPNLVQAINWKFATARSHSDTFVVFQYFHVCVSSFED